ncbi:MAG: tail fiber domain-containing protein [Verrucomicrobiae bacterium]|nr:tail fiber domain-containing protein [Verrucomicrobiae bacterium]
MHTQPVCVFRSMNLASLFGLRIPNTLDSARVWRGGGLMAVMAATVVLAAGALPVRGAASAVPPDFMTYQGFLVDANGVPLAGTSPANYPVVFRIYDASTGGAPLWSEQQIVTVDKGQFSVLLGEGSDFGSEVRPPLSQVFTSATASDRFIGITVTIDGTTTEILPRLRLLPAPYAFLARHANALVDNAGAPLVVPGSGNIVVSGAVNASAFVGNGAALTALDAGNVTSGVLNAARIPNLDASRITTGVFLSDRIPNLFASKITAGVLDSARIPNLDASKIVSGTFNTFLIPNLPASRITSGTLDLARIPGEVLRSTTGSGLTFQVAANFTRHYENTDKSRTLTIFRSNGGGHFRLNGTHTHGSGERTATYDGDSNWDFGSDRRLKKDIVDVEPMLDRALKVPVRRYRWKDEDASATHKLGVIAQEVQPLFPEMVGNFQDPDTDATTLTVGYSDFGVIAIKAIQEFKAQYDADLARLKAEMADLARENAELRNRLNQGSGSAGR